MAAPDLTKRSVCFVAKWGTDDAGYNRVGAPMAKLTIAAALADLAANYPPATAAAPHVVSIEPGTYSTPALALPPFTFITLSHDGPVNPTQGVIILLTGNLTLAAGWATNQTAFGGFSNVTIRPNAAQIIDLTLPAPAAGNPSRTLILRNFITSCDLSFQATGTADAIKLNNVTQDGSSANAIHFAGGAIAIRNMESAANVTLLDTATIVAAAQVYGLQITDAAAGLICSSVGAGFVARLGNCDLRDLTLNETAPGVITVYADAPSIPLAADLHFTGTASSADLIPTTDSGAISGGGGTGLARLESGSGSQSIQTGSIQLAGQITVVNGNAAIVGIGTTFTAIAAMHIGSIHGVAVIDSAGNVYYISGFTVVDDTNATITAVTLDAWQGPVPAATFPGVSGTYDFYLIYSNAVGNGTIAMGPSAAATGFGSVAIGFGTSAYAGAGGEALAIGDYAIAAGDFSSAVGADSASSAEGAQAFGAYVAASALNSCAFGYNFTNGTANSVGLGSGALFALATADRFEVKNPGGGASDVVICSPDATRWKILVSNIGVLTAALA